MSADTRFYNTGSLVGKMRLFVRASVADRAEYILGGARLHINGLRNFCDGERIFGFIISIAGIILELTLFILINNNAAIIPIFDSLGLTDHTGKYEVTVTADVDMNEFQERYEIIDFKNGVYTIKIKES